MTIFIAFALRDWITWPVVVTVCILFAIWKKDYVRAVLKLNKFRFSLEARDGKLKTKLK